MKHTPYVYICSETNTPNGVDLFTVGFYDPAGEWQPESDHQDSEKAADRVAHLNGSPNPALLEACKDIIGGDCLRDCPTCDGSGYDPDDNRSACYSCGGYGLEHYGDSMEAILSIRAAIALAGGPRAEAK